MGECICVGWECRGFGAVGWGICVLMVRLIIKRSSVSIVIWLF